MGEVGIERWGINFLVMRGRGVEVGGSRKNGLLVRAGEAEAARGMAPHSVRRGGRGRKEAFPLGELVRGVPIEERRGLEGFFVSGEDLGQSHVS